MSNSKPPSKLPSSPSPSAPDIQIIGDQATIYPAGYTEIPESTSSTSKQREAPSGTDTDLGAAWSSGGAEDGIHTERELIEQMSRFRTNPLEFLREVSLYVSGREWRSYDNIVGQPVYYSGFSERMKRAIAAKPMLRAKVDELATHRVQVEVDEGLLVLPPNETKAEAVRKRREREIRRSLDEVVESMTDNMICKMESKKFIRGAYYLATQLLTRAYHQGKLFSKYHGVYSAAVAEPHTRKRA